MSEKRRLGRKACSNLQWLGALLALPLGKV